MFKKAEFAQRMSVRRKQLGITAEKLAETLKVDRKSLSTWESESSETMPRDIHVLDEWCATLGLTLGEALDNEVAISEAEFIDDPAHMRAVRLWYGRYLRDKAFAQLTHKITALDSETLNLFNQMIERIANISLDEGDWISRQDLSWDKTVHVGRAKGVLDEVGKMKRAKYDR